MDARTDVFARMPATVVVIAAIVWTLWRSRSSSAAL